MNGATFRPLGRGARDDRLGSSGAAERTGRKRAVRHSWMARLVPSGLYVLNAGLGAGLAVRANLPGAFVGQPSGRPMRAGFTLGMGAPLRWVNNYGPSAT
ncbi:MAG: hypothetical protein M3220_05900 [Chloroflexota bacterium]|nr:hypothetical protein [Chloroflexota bacterium]